MTVPSAAELAAQIKHASAILADWAEEEAGFPADQIDAERGELIAALDALLARCEQAETALHQIIEGDANRQSYAMLMQIARAAVAGEDTT